MQTRRDQLDAYRFQNRRTVAALVIGRPNADEAPMRRLSVTTLAGTMIAIAVAAVFALLGAIGPAAADAWERPGAIIVERGTGARFVYLDHRLRPVLNYTSAVLAVGGTGTSSIVLVDHAELRGIARGPTLGIPGLPDSLPARTGLVSGPWTVCSRERPARPGVLATQVDVRVGTGSPVRTLPAGQAVVVRAVSGSNSYLLAVGRRFAVASAAVAAALGLPSSPLPVGTAFIDSLPAGPTLRAPGLRGAGSVSSLDVGPRPLLVGQLLHVTDNDTYLVVLADGVALLDPLETALLRTLALGEHHRPVQPTDIPESVALTLAPSDTDAAALSEQVAGLPERVPGLDPTSRDAGAVCAVYRGGQVTFGVPTARATPAVRSAAQVAESSRSRGGQADQVVLPPNAAALVSSAAPTRPSDARTARTANAKVEVVAAPGRRYPLADRGVLASFGYRAADVRSVPARLLALLPSGPTLDSGAARRAGG